MILTKFDVFAELIIDCCGTALAIFILYSILLFAFVCGSLIMLCDNICTNLGVYDTIEKGFS